MKYVKINQLLSLDLKTEINSNYKCFVIQLWMFLYQSILWKENVRNDAKKSMMKKRYYSAEGILHPVFSVQLFFSPTDALLLRCSHVR